jgi:hypothetical protein
MGPNQVVKSTLVCVPSTKKSGTVIDPALSRLFRNPLTQRYPVLKNGICDEAGFEFSPFPIWSSQ